MIDRRLFGYILSGGSAAVIDLGVMLALIAGGSSVPVAAVVSFAVAAVWNYMISARFVFRQPHSRNSFLAFLGFAILGAVINVGITTLAAAGGLSPAIAKVIGIGIAFFFNFAVNRWIVFRDRTLN